MMNFNYQGFNFIVSKYQIVDLIFGYIHNQFILNKILKKFKPNAIDIYFPYYWNFFLKIYLKPCIIVFLESLIIYF